MRVGPQAYRTVTAPYSRVLLGALGGATTEPAIESVSVTRELPSGLPNQVVGGAGVAAATAEVTWAQPEAIRDTDVSPWRHGDKPAIPLPGTPARILMGGDTGMNQYVFTGEVEDSVGGTGDSVSSSLVDHLYSRFHRQVSISPKARWMYPPREAADYRLVGLTYVYVVDAILRECGYFTTPPPEYDVVVSVPGQGTMWPAIGLCETAGVPAGSTTGNSHASFLQADGRLYVTDGAATIRPSESRPVTAGVQISLVVGADHTGLTDITVPYGANSIRLRITATGNAAAYYDGASVVGLTSVRGTTVSLLVKPNGQWSLQSTASSPATGTQALSGTDGMGDVSISAANGAQVAGIQVSHPATAAHEHASLLYVKNAHIRPGTISHGLLEVHRAINSEKALDVLQEIAKATCSQFRLDEDGHARWDGPGVLQGQSPVATIQAANNLLSLNWRVSLDHTRASTTVEWDRPAISRSRWPKITFYDGRSESLAVGDELADFIEVPSSEEWLGVHLPAVYAGADTGGDERVNRGVGSVVGGTGQETDGDPSGEWFSPTYGSASIEPVGDGKYLYKMTVNSVPGGAETFTTSIDPGPVSSIWPKWIGAHLPILRGYIKASWAKQNRRCQSTYLGDPNRPHLVHDGGGWLQQGPGFELFGDGDQPGKAANWIQQQCQTPQVEVTGCEIMPDTRLQLGDVINLVDPDNLAVALRVLITKITLAQSGPEMSQSLSFQVIAASPTAVTYAELEDLWAGADYAALEAAWDGQTYAALEADPLKESL